MKTNLSPASLENSGPEYIRYSLEEDFKLGISEEGSDRLEHQRIPGQPHGIFPLVAALGLREKSVHGLGEILGGKSP